MADFFERSVKETSYWDRISSASIDRIFSRYTWNIYASRMVSLCHVYSFWNHVTGLERSVDAKKRYLEAIYILKMRKLMETVSFFKKFIYSFLCKFQSVSRLVVVVATMKKLCLYSCFPCFLYKLRLRSLVCLLFCIL
jgi:hypothetical protein